MVVVCASDGKGKKMENLKDARMYTRMNGYLQCLKRVGPAEEVGTAVQMMRVQPE